MIDNDMAMFLIGVGIGVIGSLVVNEIHRAVDNHNENLRLLAEADAIEEAIAGRKEAV